jgi:hypothetical protein
MREVVEVNAEKVWPENDAEDAFDEIQVQKADGEQPANKPQHAAKGILLDLDLFHTFSSGILLHGVTSVVCGLRGIVAHCHGVLSAKRFAHLNRLAQGDGGLTRR